ncbi:putative actinidain [Helianthus annuus]|uniref:Actinidain n=1 Tax=Helianthus annuus TaxID=4232 RepID=A0A251VF54_HELAN|nr:putative actinidain [Helianthus annuus]KAJ0604441.1 putative actinidain [Helianthus annuus]KAJ0951418.1 putative actinidain [Helianthus annuus]
MSPLKVNSGDKVGQYRRHVSPLKMPYSCSVREWKVEHGKTYPTADEEKRRFETFQQHLREIEAHNSGPDVAYYTKGLNPFSEQFKLGFLMHESVDDGLYDSERDEEDVIRQSDDQKR